MAEDESEFVKVRKRTWARLIARVYLEDPSLCAACGKPMRIIAALTSPHQDTVIEKILRARGEWAPPWKRERRARGPPTIPGQLEILFDDPVFCDPQVAVPAAESQLPSLEEEDLSQARPEGEEEFHQASPEPDDPHEQA